MVIDLDSDEKMLPAENAATGGMEMSRFKESRLEMAKIYTRGKGQLHIIHRNKRLKL
ncbi:uncharacterized protein LOC117147096 [Drosophila mauritiana]|uniref:Uncharacterized protein LOC117147096 n=1 Tax=Drosophila mauritiana TaxID=7226 RepID=A0A6P8KL33_DROMA|nr:uncharacterized protein LOC117147096 [Drosophila mauritiana]